MFFPEGRFKVFVYGKPTDMRKSFHGLYGLTKQVLGEDPLSGHLFVFINRRGNYLKVFYFDRTGYCIWAKRLERGRYQWNRPETTQIEWTDLKLILEGIDRRQTRQYLRYHHTVKK